MIEQQFLKKKMKMYQVEEFISNTMNKAGYSHTEIKKTPLGDKVIVYTSKPGLIVGRRGENIKELTETLKTKFGLDNPQIEVAEIENPNLNARAVAKRIIHTFERFGPKRFKSIGYRALQDILDAGALGAEIVISGRGVPSQRAKSWRFKAGYLKKSGDISENYIKKSAAIAHLRSGAVGIKVNILTPDVILPDKITFKKPEITEAKPIETQQKKEDIPKETKKTKKETKKKAPRKKTVKENGDTQKS
ncbi:30S ribosomal protein S3 [Candidatus Woesearchaeota archaeon]|nr:30S ribosomal protein S3 [Candidatus Woesearchaeota archaeon]